MQNDKRKRRFAGKGYYIALIACIAAVGISGYVFVRTARNSAVETSAPAVISTAPAESARPSQDRKTGQGKAGTGSTPAPSAAPSTETESAADRMEDAYEETMADAEELEPVVLWPVQGEVAAVFSQDTLSYSRTMADWRTHEGLDIAAEADTPVCAAQDGTVTAVYEDDFLGNVVVVSHSGDLATLYANLADLPEVAAGDPVYAGQMLGRVGSSALLETAEPAHLHFEVYENGSAVDPLDYLPE
ncbi:MAG: M23 family metallopeptidase [Oscillospiraceae bacterium]|nr:M23 family metallopeptidase [Oscillospiraceae bacterium]